VEGRSFHARAAAAAKAQSPIVVLSLRGTNTAGDMDGRRLLHRATSVTVWSSTWASYRGPCYKHPSIMVYNVEEEEYIITTVK